MQTAFDGERELCDVCLGEGLDLRSGETLRNEGIARVSGATTMWQNHAAREIKAMAERLMTFTADDLRERMPTPPKPNAVGAAFSHAAKSGLIRRTGGLVKSKRPEAHSRLLPEWTKQ